MPTDNPIFTVVVPVYNVEKYIKQCIESIINQTFKDFELLIIDDCSTDNSMKIAEELSAKDSRITLLYGDKNRGVGYVRNRGIDLAKGKYIMFTDSDDWIEPWTLKLLYDTFQDKDVTSICYDGYTYLDYEQKVCEGKLIDNVEGYLTFTPDNICCGSDYCLKAYTTESIRDKKIYYPAGLHFEDGEFYFKYFALNPKTYILADQLYYYRRRENSIVTNKNMGIVRLEDIYQVIKNIREFYKERGIYEKYKKSLLQLTSTRIDTCRNICKSYERSLPLSKDILKEFNFPNEFEDIRKKSPYFSVIVPFYNVEKYIEKCLESIQGQTFSDIEIICVDDCGKDNSSKIVKKLAKEDCRIKVVKHSKNKGLGAARNTGMKYAQGEYVLFVDSDDWIDINTLQILYDKIQETRLDVISFKVNVWWENLQKMTDMFYFSPFVNLPEGYFELNDANLYTYPSCVWNKVYKRSFLQENNIYCPENLYFEDVEFYFKIFIYAKEHYVINKNLYYYRRRDDSILGSSCSNPSVAEHMFDAGERIYKFLVKNKLFKQYKKAFMYLVNTNVNTWRSYPNVQKQLLPRIKSYLNNVGFPDKYYF